MSELTPDSQVFATIVADPPWPMPDSGKRTGSTQRQGTAWWHNHVGRSTDIPYRTMTVEEIKALKVPAAKNAHLYLWTTDRFLEEAFDVVRTWGFRKAQTIGWCKPPMGKGHGGAFVNTMEFLIFARRGSLPTQERIDSTWFKVSRVYENGHIKHSAKPEFFLDIVERVSPGPYLEMFARRNRLGWHTWGDEALEHVEVAT